MIWVDRDENDKIIAQYANCQYEGQECLVENGQEYTEYQITLAKIDAKRQLDQKINEFLSGKITIDNLSWRVETASQLNILTAIENFDAVLQSQKSLGYIATDSNKVLWASTGLVSREDLMAIKDKIIHRKSIILGSVKFILESQIDSAETIQAIYDIVSGLDLNTFL